MKKTLVVGRSKTIAKGLEKIMSKGTRIVSFDYDGERRNVLVGANGTMLGHPTWGEQLNRAVRFHKGTLYLVGLVNNEGPRGYKTFKFAKIRNASFC